MHHPVIKYLFIAIGLLFGSAYLPAQSKLDSIQHLKEVVVTNTRVTSEVIPVQILSGQLLEKLNVHNVADALRYFSGVQLKDYGGIGGLKTVNIRSMGSQHVGVFYDGIEIGNAQNGVVDLGRFSLDNIEAISLYNGQKSTIFQPAKDYSSASSIYMVTKTPEYKGSKRYNISALLRVGAFGVVNPSVLWEQKLSEKVSASLNTEYMSASGKYKFTYRVKNTNTGIGGYDTTATRQNGDIEFIRIEQAFFGKVNNGEWKTRAYFYTSERGYPGAIVREEPGRFKHEDRQWDKNFFFQSSFKKRINERYSTLLSAKYAYDYLHYKTDTLVPLRVENKYKLNEIYVSSANMVNILPFWNVNVSTDFQWNRLSANLTEFIYPQRYNTWVAAATSLDFKRLKIQASVLGTFIHESMREEREVKKNWVRYTPTLVASWQPFQQYDLSLRAFYKKIFRMPTFNEIYYTFIGSGTSNLKPEYTTQYNLGITYGKVINKPLLYKFEGQVDAYYNQVTDKLLAIPGGQNFRWTMMNIGYVKIRGLDVALMANSRFGKDWTLDTRLNYTYQKAQDYSADKTSITYRGQISYVPWHSGSAIVTTGYKSWDFNYSFIYTGERYTQSANIAENRVKEWYTHDLSLAKSFVWQQKQIRLTAEVNNVFNQQYDVVLNYPMPGTNFKFIFNIIL